MSKPRIKDIRRAYVLDIIIRGDPENETGISQKEINKRVLNEQYKENINKLFEKGRKTIFKGKELEKKIYVAVSKTVNSLEKDGIINITSLRTPGKGGAENIIKLNTGLKAFYNLLKVYKTLKAYNEEQYLPDFYLGFTISIFETNLLISGYYKKIVNKELVNKLTSLSWLPFDEKDKELLYYLIMNSQEALESLFNEVYTHDFKLKTENLNDYEKRVIKLDNAEDYKIKFIKRIQVNFIKVIFNNLELPNFNIEGNINVKFRDEKDNLIYSFSNKHKVDRELQPLTFPFIEFI